MGHVRDFYLDRYKSYLQLLRSRDIGVQQVAHVSTDAGKGIMGAINADREHGNGEYDTVTPALFRDFDCLVRMEKARLTAVLFIEVLANKTCHAHYPEYHERFQTINKFPLSRGAPADSAYDLIVDARGVFTMAFGHDNDAWLREVLSEVVPDLRWIVSHALSRDEVIDQEIDKQKFWAKCVDRFPDWLQEQGKKSLTEWNTLI